MSTEQEDQLPQEDQQPQEDQLSQVTLEEVWECYNRLQSLRAAGKELGLGHMSVRNRLVKGGYKLTKRDPSMQALNPRDKAYLRPSQIEKIDMLAGEEGRTRHEMARILVDESLDARGMY